MAFIHGHTTHSVPDLRLSSNQQAARSQKGIPSGSPLMGRTGQAWRKKREVAISQNYTTLAVIPSESARTF